MSCFRSGLLAALLLTAAPAWAEPVASVETLQAQLKASSTSAETLTLEAIARIKAQDGTLHAVIALNPDAVAQAKAVDALRKKGKSLGPLMGIPVLIKDNIETKDSIATTAGSLALKDNITGRDAPLVARLRAGGAIILGKTNLSEWANFRSTRSMSGWSAVGGLVTNPHDPARTACGSSSGSGAAVAAGYVALAVGSETDGSITCPASINGVVGLKPTLGLISRTHIVPISHSQDTAGPMGQNVRDVAVMLGVMAGSDPVDAATLEADAHRIDYVKDLKVDALKGVRIGVLRDKIGPDPKVQAAFEDALKTLTKAGAVLIDVPQSKVDGLGAYEQIVLETEFKADLNAYLATTPTVVKTRTLADLIAFNTANAAQEMPLFGQETFIASEARKGLDDPGYILARDMLKVQSQTRIDSLLKAYGVVMLVAPTTGPAWFSDPVNGDQTDASFASSLPATAGYPHLSVPMGKVSGLPVGLSFIGPKWGDAALLKAGYAFEQARDK